MYQCQSSSPMRSCDGLCRDRVRKQKTCPRIIQATISQTRRSQGHSCTLREWIGQIIIELLRFINKASFITS